MLLATDDPGPSAPTASLFSAFSALGLKAVHVSLRSSSVFRWARLARRFDAFVFVRYERADPVLAAKLHSIRAASCLTVRYWVGSDVLYCLRSERNAAAARRLDRAVDRNIAAAPHLVGELAEIGISAVHVPSVIDSDIAAEPRSHSLPERVLAYLPTERRAFYGQEQVRRAAEIIRTCNSSSSAMRNTRLPTCLTWTVSAGSTACNRSGRRSERCCV